MLLGEHEHTIDDKGRLTLPAKFRAPFAAGIVLTRGMDGCLAAYTREDWSRLRSEFASLDPLSRDGRWMRRFFFSGAAESELDRQGRVSIPPALAKHAGLEREVVVAGVEDHVEIWDRATWNDQLNEIEGSAEDVAERLAATRH